MSWMSGRKTNIKDPVVRQIFQSLEVWLRKFVAEPALTMQHSAAGVNVASSGGVPQSLAVDTVDRDQSDGLLVMSGGGVVATPGAGLWRVDAIVSWLANSSGYRLLELSYGLGPTRLEESIVAPAPGLVTVQQFSTVVVADGTTGYQLRVRQNSGSTLTATVLRYTWHRISE